MGRRDGRGGGSVEQRGERKRADQCEEHECETIFEAAEMCGENPDTPGDAGAAENAYAEETSGKGAGGGAVRADHPGHQRSEDRGDASACDESAGGDSTEAV